MLKNLILILFLFAIGSNQAQTTINGSFVHGGINRTYSFYVPASYTSGQPVPLVIGLHGTSSSGSLFAQYRDFRPIADTANFILVHPDGSSFFGVKFWNYGSEVPSSVDDIGFLEALIDTISAQYSINQNRVYCMGMSNGSFMSYTLACQSDRFAAIAGVAGSMSTSVYDACNPTNAIPTMHIHGTADDINPYAGNGTMVPIEDVSLFWTNQNNCFPTPTITPIPNTDPNDGATAERYLYANGTNGNTVELFKITGGEHTWPGSPMPSSTDIICMDFDARKEIWRFFSKFELSTTNSVANQTKIQSKVWPNPTQGEVNIQIENQVVKDVEVFDLQGRLVEKVSNYTIQNLDLSHLKTGNYLIKISGNNFNVVKKLLISSSN